MERKQKHQGSPEQHGSLLSKQISQLEQFFAERNGYRDIKDQKAWVEVLAETPGIDPVLAIAEGQGEMVPTDGWLISANIAPGYGGVINIRRYPEGSFKAESLSDDREEYGEARLHFELNGYGGHVIAYENPNYPTKDTEPHQRMTPESWTGLGFADTDIVPLENGGRLLDESSRAVMMDGGRCSGSIDSKLPDQGAERSTAAISRAVGGIEEVGAVLVQLGAGMGLEQNDVRALMESVAQKVGHLA